MRTRRQLFALAATTYATLSACSSSPKNTPLILPPLTEAPALTFSPSTAQFSIEESDPIQAATLSKLSAIEGPLTFTYSDPTVAAVDSDPISGSSAVIKFEGVAAGTTTVTVTDASDAQGTITLKVGPCGRPDPMTQNPVLLNVADGATGVSTKIGTLYFGVYTVTTMASGIKLHVIVDQNQAFEAGTLQDTALPAGVPTAPPAPAGSFSTLSYQSIAVPTLTTNTAYRVQLHDNACSPAIIPASFTTGAN